MFSICVSFTSNKCSSTFFLIHFSVADPFTLSGEVQRSQLQTERWFHGVISRPIAEALLHNDGDFLVRESRAKPGQYVLTGLQIASAKHLLLIDPEGVVSPQFPYEYVY